MRRNKPDPHNGFKNDLERRRALSTRAVCLAIVGVAIALSPSLPKAEVLMQWLRALALFVW